MVGSSAAGEPRAPGGGTGVGFKVSRPGLAPPGIGQDRAGGIFPKRGPFNCSAGRQGREVFFPPSRPGREGRSEGCLKYSGIVAIGSGHLKR